ncbi:MAG TPA: aromatic amino acid lyase, partial [Aestuariivirgaceae bacterium]|nr:aromatic amino acid lyase [Aestuariivirgaceae bacterium]
MSGRVVLNGRSLTPATVERIANADVHVEIAKSTRAVMKRSRRLVEKYLKEGIPAYGLNTGLGARVNEPLPEKELQDFSYRMVRGRAQGLGEPLSVPAVRA